MALPLSRCTAVLCALLVAPFGPLAVHAASTIETLQKTVADLSALRTETARVEAEWRWQEKTLTAIGDTLKLRTEALERNQAAFEAQSIGQDRETATLSQKAAELRARIAEFDSRLRGVAAELIALRPSLPPRLSLALELPYRSLANDSLDTAERMQHVSTVWTRCAQFNRAITGGEETLDLGASANPRVFDVIYWGLSHGYALDRGRNVAFVGAPAPQGWEWREDPALAPLVARLIAIHRDQADPEFVELPAAIADRATPPAP